MMQIVFQEKSLCEDREFNFGSLVFRANVLSLEARDVSIKVPVRVKSSSLKYPQSALYTFFWYLILLLIHNY